MTNRLSAELHPSPILATTMRLGLDHIGFDNTRQVSLYLPLGTKHKTIKGGIVRDIRCSRSKYTCCDCEEMPREQ